MSKRSRLLESIAETVADYRDGEIAAPTPEHVDIWIKQFDTSVQVPMLNELDHVLEHTYISKGMVTELLSGLVANKKVAGDDPSSFWEDARFLDIQDEGNSQREMLGLFGEALKEECGLELDACGKGSSVYVYLDDAIFTGNRVLNDLRAWVRSSASAKATLHIVVAAYHRLGQYYASSNLNKVIRECEKDIDTHWWHIIEIENRKTYRRNSDVLWPTRLPDDPLVEKYASSLSYSFSPRPPGSVGENGFFSSEQGRDLLEQEFLKAGAKIRSQCPFLGKYQRPLGNIVLESLGFGALLVTFRNCPNNCPLAFWVGDPWYPLFARKTNR